MQRSKALAFVTVVCAIASVASRPAVARVIFVSNDGPADFRTIQAAIDDANDGDTVLVAPGTYTGDGNRDIDFRGKAITLKSETGPEFCVIQCGGRQKSSRIYPPIEAEYHRGFYFHSNEDANSIVQGFTVTQGYLRVENGGAFCCTESSPVIRDCIIIGNVARRGGGIDAYRADIRVENCVIRDNIAGSIPLDLDSHAYGHGEGGGMSIIRSNARIVNCLIVANTVQGNGGGISCSRGDPVEIVNCTITGNRTGYWGNGGGISLGPDSGYMCYLRNSIVWGNLAGASGNDVALWHSAPILWIMRARIESSLIGDDPNDFFDPYERANGDWITGDPQFVAPGRWDPNGTPDESSDDFWVDGNYHLKSQAGRWDPNSRTWVQDDVTSPCIDAGDPGSPIGEEPFPNGGRINIGAYGGTAEASKSYFGQPNCLCIVAGDVNGDCRVGLPDLALLTDHWLEDRSEYGRVTTTCRFIESRSSIDVTSRVSQSHPVEGEFRLSIDVAAGTASFDEVDATWGAEPGPTGDLNAFFQMTELVSTNVKSTRIEFVFRKNIPRFPCADVELTVTFHQGFVHLSGGYLAPVWDGAEYDLDAMAVPVDDPRRPQSIARMLEMIIAGDVDGNCRVDFADLAAMTSHWREVGPRAYIK